MIDRPTPVHPHRRRPHRALASSNGDVASVDIFYDVGVISSVTSLGVDPFLG